MREGRGVPQRTPLLQSRGRSASPIVRFHSPRVETEVRPKAVLTTVTLLGVIYTASISGGYGLEESVSAGGPLLSIVFLCLIPFIWGIPVSLCVAELSCAIPSNAGPIMWVNCAFPSWVTFTAVLWTAFLNLVDNSLYPTVFADYCTALFHLGWLEGAFLKIAFLWMCAIINIVGVTLVGIFSVGIMLITILPFFLIFLLQLPHGLDWERITYIPDSVNWAVFLPVIAWNFSGFDSAGNVIEEVQNPNPTFIRALILMIAAALATYIPPILAGASAEKLNHVRFDQWDDGFWVKVGAAVGGTPMAATVMIGGAISTLGLMTTLLATTSRSLAGMGTLNAFPTVFFQVAREVLGYLQDPCARHPRQHHHHVRAVCLSYLSNAGAARSSALCVAPHHYSLFLLETASDTAAFGSSIPGPRGQGCGSRVGRYPDHLQCVSHRDGHDGWPAHLLQQPHPHHWHCSSLLRRRPLVPLRRI
ncbi:hypothetical protein GH5_01244 [Leishmania sp. Ghana 2012 LV757]|uniref:hypothetical protein n=1 Tax=Leishmania sp. Ghana 2012 LV757 TaxID=2803181 RepID=UPI001B770A18|nr:hypothetical protein GH5_01244 [Leishmania sp. Ghana 2012 LV757]